MKNKYLICIVGPTAIGKTALSLHLGRTFNTEILSADSRQFFKEMSIGTAAPTKDELDLVPHHFIHHKSIEESYSVGDFEKDAVEKLEELYLKKDVTVLVGGSGLYVDAVVNGLDYFPKVNPQIRLELNKELETKGIASLQQSLRNLDPAYYEIVDKNNPHRLIRALEICLGTGETYSSFRRKKDARRPFKTLYVGLTAERDIIYSRINERVEKMMREGLLEEVEALVSKKELNALNTVGYKELFKYKNGDCSLEEAVWEIKKNTRRFAKRQLTWFRKNEDINWFDYDTAYDEIAGFLQEKIQK